MNSTRLMRIGMASLLIGSLGHYLIRPAAPFEQDLADGAFGVLLGVAIGTLLLSLRRGGRPCPRG